MAYNDKYIIYFKSLHDHDYEFHIQEKDYSGSSSELTGTSKPVIRELKGENDDLEDRIMMSGCKVIVESLTDYALMDLFSSDGRKFKGKAYCDSVLYWQGFLTPDYYSEPYMPPPYQVTLYFTDGLGYLKNIDFDEFGSIGALITNHMMTLWEGFKNCILKTGNALALCEGVNIYEENNNQTDVDSMTTQNYFNFKRFDSSYTYYEVLDELLKSMGNARLWQQDGKWWVVSPNAMKADYVIRNYNESWTYVDYETISPKIAVTDNQQTDANLNVFLDEPTLTIQAAWKKFILKHDFGYRENILDLKDYTIYGTMDVDTEGYISSTPSEGYRSIRQTDYVLKVQAPAGVFSANNYLLYNLGSITGKDDFTVRQYLKVHFNPSAYYSSTGLATIISAQIYIETSGGTRYYLRDFDGHWSSEGVNTFDITHDEAPVEIRSKTIYADGTLYLKLFRPFRDSVACTMYFLTENDFSINIESEDRFYEEVTIETDINSEQNYIPDEYTMTLADLPECDNNELIYHGGLFRLSGGDYIPTKYWNKKGSTELKHLVNLVADEISVNHVRPMAMISGSLRCNFKPGTIVQAPISSNRLFILNRFSEDMYNDEWDVDMVEFSYAEQAYLKLRSGGYVTLRGGGKIKLRN